MCCIIAVSDDNKIKHSNKTVNKEFDNQESRDGRQLKYHDTIYHESDYHIQQQ